MADLCVRNMQALKIVCNQLTCGSRRQTAIMREVRQTVHEGMYTDFHTGQQFVLAQYWERVHKLLGMLTNGGTYEREALRTIRMFLPLIDKPQEND